MTFITLNCNKRLDYSGDSKYIRIYRQHKKRNKKLHLLEQGTVITYNYIPSQLSNLFSLNLLKNNPYHLISNHPTFYDIIRNI